MQWLVKELLSQPLLGLVVVWFMRQHLQLVT
jgi:hypothetical protein